MSTTEQFDLPKSPKGMHDILPSQVAAWDRVRKVAREIADYYSFVPIETPVLESLSLFERSIGEPTEIVEKQMFTVNRRGSGEQLVLRPEATAPIARSFIQHSLSQLGMPVKLYYEGPMFRYEQPQAGRYRQFHQIDFEIFSTDDDPIYDAQVMLVFCRMLETLKIREFCMEVNTIGCSECRPQYRKKLVAYYKPHKRSLCKDCQRRFEVNPLRLLDCKVEACQKLRVDAPIMLESICKRCHDHFTTTLEYLDELKLPYTLNQHLVRGLDYYTKTVFEMVVGGSGNAIGGGGRYDDLVKLLGGQATPAVGWAAGVERIIETMETQGISVPTRRKPKAFFIYVGDTAKKKSLLLIEELRKANIDISESLGRESLKGQLRAADKSGAPLALIFGQKEAFEQSIIIRDLGSGTQETIPLEKMVDGVKKKLRNHA